MTMNEHVLAVGASRGLGKVFAEMASARGFLVSTVARSSLTQEGHYRGDICNAAEVVSLLERIVAERGPLTNMVLFQRFRGNPDDWEGEMATSLFASKTFIEGAVSYFDRRRPGSIVLVSSVAAVMIWRTQPCSYHIVKAGLCQMARYYAVMLGRHNIRVNAVCPSTFVKPESEDFYQANPDIQQRLRRASPLNRMGSAQDVANAIFFLLSDNASFITGQSLTVDGGISLQAQETMMPGFA